MIFLFKVGSRQLSVVSCEAGRESNFKNLLTKTSHTKKSQKKDAAKASPERGGVISSRKRRNDGGVKQL